MLLAATLSQSSSSKAATTPNLRSSSRGIPNLTHDDAQGTDSKIATAKIKEETILESPNERRLAGPHPGGGGGSSSSSGSGGGSSSGGSDDSGGGGSSGGSDSASTTAPNDSSETEMTTTTTSSASAVSSETRGRIDGSTSEASDSFVASGFKWKDLQFVGTDKSTASITVAVLGAVMCLTLLLSIIAIASHKIVTSKSTNDDSDGILRNDNNKAEQLVSASLD